MKSARIQNMFRSQARTALLVGAVLIMVGFVVWPGCATAPLPSKRTAIGTRTKSQFKIKESQHLTRAEIVERFGRPDAFVPDIRVACYRVNDVTRREMFLLFFVIPVYFSATPNSVDVAFIEFDEQDRVRRVEIETCYDRSLPELARQWFNKKQHPHPSHVQKSQNHLPQH
jgi:hypothetical protein